ncbi:MAG: hypothetical protein M3413_02065 [Bacteroidota bacterium]|nr:hypothetical protein [Flavisolibacter sp.]MDQ3550288.1 hypothetical protein [Bacteroidota bacterium]
MKKTASILLLLILIFNIYGYRLVFNWIQDREEYAFTDQIISNNFNEEELISIKIAAELPPYTTESNDYEWKDGELAVNGNIYKYVKRKILKDSIEFLCLPHEGKMKVENAREEFFKLCNDLQTSNQKQAPVNKVVKPFVFEGIPQLQTVNFNLQITENKKHHLSFISELSQICLSTPGQPPEAV